MRRVVVRVETPRGGFVKRRDDGSVDFVSPLPCPFHYGSVPGTSAADGDPVDALVVGSRTELGVVRRGTELEVSVYGEVAFVDAGKVDVKLVTARRPPTRAERAIVVSFFTLYARAKRALYRVRGETGPASGRTELDGVRWEMP